MAAAIVDALDLQPGDELLEIGCGGGLLLREAVRRGAHATGIDHSDEMVTLAGERAPEAQVVLAEAEALPFAESTFSAIAMSIVFFFFDDPVAVLRECRRVLYSAATRTVSSFGSARSGSTMPASSPLRR